LVGLNVEALTGGETFRIPLTRCDVVHDGQRILVRDLEGKLAIWSDEAHFLDALEHARRGALKGQVQRIRSQRRRRRALELGGKTLFAAAVIFFASIPIVRWAVGGGISSIANHIGESALHQLHLPSGQAPAVEKRLAAIADQLQPATLLPTHAFRVLLADYDDVHTFHMPPDVVVVTSALVCSADEPNLVTAAIALELAHLEARDVTSQMTVLIDWHTSMDLVSGDTTKLREYMLDFADSRRSPGYTPAQETAAKERAIAILKQVALPLESGQDIATLVARVKELHIDPAHTPGPLPPKDNKDNALDWSTVRAEACDLVGR